MRRLLASLGVAAAPMACSLAVSLDGLSGGPTNDAAVEANGGPDGAAIDAAVRDDGPATTADGAPDAPNTGWAALSVVQHAGSTAQPTASFDKPTTAGTLLVAMRPDAAPPSGAGWVPAVSSNGADAIFSGRTTPAA
ncbi:MAG: hypothetical protein QM702_21465 [Rubrivivax sp.]